jgi:hypothetical protein
LQTLCQKQEIGGNEKGEDISGHNVESEIDLCRFLRNDQANPNGYLSEKMEKVGDKPCDTDGDEKFN